MRWLQIHPNIRTREKNNKHQINSNIIVLYLLRTNKRCELQSTTQHCSCIRNRAIVKWHSSLLRKSRFTQMFRLERNSTWHITKNCMRILCRRNDRTIAKRRAWSGFSRHLTENVVAECTAARIATHDYTYIIARMQIPVTFGLSRMLLLYLEIEQRPSRLIFSQLSNYYLYV